MDIFMQNAEMLICAARKKFKEGEVLSDSSSKMLIGHFTDIHGDIKRFKNALSFFEKYKPDFVIHTGDMVVWNSEDNVDWFFDGINSLSMPAYNCIGNHETFDNSHPLTNEELYKKYIKELKNISNDSKKGYYFADFEAFKLRLIVLNDYDLYLDDWRERGRYAILQEQCDWLIGALEDAEKKELGVIIASHESDEPVLPGSNGKGFCQRFEPHPWGYGKEHEHIVADIVDAFMYGKKLEKKYELVNIACSFTKESEFICYLNGHRHGDYVGYLPSYPKQLSICLTCSGCFPEGYHNIGEEISDLPRIPDTVTEDAINFYTIDREKREISVVRLGACINDKFEQRIAAIYEY